MLDLTQSVRNTRFKRHRKMRKLSWSLKCLHRRSHGIIVPIALGMQHDRVITLSSLIPKPWQKIWVESKTYRESIVTVGSFNIALGFILVLGLLPRTFLPGTMMSAEYPTLVQRRSLVEFFQSPQKVQTAVCIFTIYQDISYSKMFSYTL